MTVDVINTIPMNAHNLRSIVSGGHSWKNEAYDSIEVEGQLQVEKINGHLWSDIVKRIVWKDLSAHIDGVTSINGVSEFCT